MPVLGITGTGGAGKSSLTDELVRRLRLDQGDTLRVAVISIDPSRRKSGGALLGDRIRMNAIAPWSQRPARVHALAGHARHRQRVSAALPDVIAACKAAGFDLIMVETSGIGQGDAAIVPLVDMPMYVMTPEFGAASQLEKIDMLDFAEFVAINKFDRKGAHDALRDVAKQVQRNREAFGMTPDADAGVRHHGRAFQRRRRDRAVPGAQAAPERTGLELHDGKLPLVERAPQHQPDAGRAARAHPLSGRDCRHRARLQEAGARTGAAGARDPAAARAAAHAAGGRRRPARRRKPRSAWPRSAKLARTRPRRKLLAQWPEMRRPTPATSTWSRSATRRSAPRSPPSRSAAPRSARWRCRSTRTTARSSSG